MRKTISMMSLLLGFAVVSCAQGIPTKVKDAFKTKFPDAKSIKWDKENETEWEAEFKLKGVSYSANFSTDGEWKETEHKIKFNDLPENIKNTLKTEFDGYEVEEVEAVEKPNFNGYNIEVDKDEKTIEIVFDRTGKIVEKKNVEDEED